MASTTAKVAKDKGNAFFKAGDYAEAVGHYSAAIVADRTDPTYPLNRAAAYLKLGKHRDAERDCATVLRLDPKNVKALFRRAQARIALENLTEAERDLKYALQLEPSNETIQQEIDVVESKLKIVNKEPSNNRGDVTVSPLPSSSQSHAERDEPPPKRIIRSVPIEIVQGDELLAKGIPLSPTTLLKPIRSRVLSPSSTSSPALSPPPSSPSSLTSQPKPRVGAAIFRADGKRTIIRDPASPSSATTILPSPSPSHLSYNQTNGASSSALSSPVTHFAFSRAWYALSTSHERYSLLRRIPPGSLPTLFQTSLEPALLVSILQALSVVVSSTTSPEIAEYMNAFPAVPRFATVVLFLSSEEKAVVRKLWDMVGDGHDSGRRLWGL